jgi:hypothetical protein
MDGGRATGRATSPALTLRFTWEHLTQREAWVAQTVKRALALRVA